MKSLKKKVDRLFILGIFLNSEGSETNHVLFSLYFFFRFGLVWFVRVCFRLGLQCSRRLGSNPVLDRTSILFIKSEFHCERFALLRNSSIPD